MKYILFLLLTISFSATGQRVDTSKVKFTIQKPGEKPSSYFSHELSPTHREVKYVYNDEHGNTQSVGFIIPPGRKDSIFFIQGDTVELLKQLILSRLEESDQSVKERRKLENALQKAVDFINDIPAYYKNKTVSPLWPEYIEAILKQGYRITDKEKLLPKRFYL